MTEIKIYKCDYCGKESKVYKKLLKHEAACKEEHERQLAYEANKQILEKEFLENFDLNNLGQCINDYLIKINGDYFSELSWRLYYSDKVGNTHDCPINGVTNWRREDDKPKGYPGFSGTIKGKRSKDGHTLAAYSSRHYIIPGINTGTGGGGLETWEYQIRIFIQDFPGLQEKTNRSKIKAKLLDVDKQYIVGSYVRNEDEI